MKPSNECWQFSQNPASAGCILPTRFINKLSHSCSTKVLVLINNSAMLRGYLQFTRFPGGCFLLAPPTINTTPQQASPTSVMLCCQPAIDLFCRGRNRTASTALQAANGIPASISLRHFFFAITEKWLYFEMIGLPGSPKGSPHHKRNSFCSLAKPID